MALDALILVNGRILGIVDSMVMAAGLLVGMLDFELMDRFLRAPRKVRLKPV